MRAELLGTRIGGYLGVGPAIKEKENSRFPATALGHLCHQTHVQCILVILQAHAAKGNDINNSN